MKVVCSWYDFATEIVQEAGLKCKVIPILSKEYPSAAQRPFYSVLDKSKIKENYGIEIPHWRRSLKRCIKLLIYEVVRRSEDRRSRSQLRTCGLPTSDKFLNKIISN